MFFLELNGGNPFICHWSAVPIRIIYGHRIDTLLTSIFMHAGFLHIIGNMIYLWAFGPPIEQAMGWLRFLLFHLSGRLVAMFAQVTADPFPHIPCLGASGAIAAVMGAFIMIFPGDRIRTLVFFLIFLGVTYIPAAFLIGFWSPDSVVQRGVGGRGAHRRRRLHGPHCGLPVWRDPGAAVAKPAAAEVLSGRRYLQD